MSAEIFTNIYNGPFKRYLLISKNIGHDVQKQSEIADLAFQAERRYIEYSENFKRPETSNIFLSPINHLMDKIIRFACTDPSLSDHINVIAKSIRALLWIQEKDPVVYLEEVLTEAKTYTDMVLVFFKNKDLHEEWVEAWLETLNDLNNFVRRRYPRGIIWKGELEVPNVGMLQDMTEYEILNSGSLYNEISKGHTIQEALRRVNSQSVDQSEDQQEEISNIGTVFHREGKKWKIEHQYGTNKYLTINEADLDNAISIYDCKNMTVVVERKVNVIKLDSCEKISLIFRSLISGLEMIGCKDIKLHAFGNLPSIIIDSCSDVNIHLTKKALDAQVMTSKCLKISVSYPMEDGYYKTFDIPSRQMTTINQEHGLKTIAVLD